MPCVSRIRRIWPRLPLPLLAVAAVVAPSVASVPVGQVSRGDGERFERKLAEIVSQSEARPTSRIETRISEAELNAYLAYQGRPQVPAGVVDPQITILGEGRLVGRAVVDLDAVRVQQSSGRWLDPISYLRGRLPVTATGLLRTRAGVAWLDVDTVQVAGVTVPKQLLQTLVSHYSRTPEMPQGLSLDDPFSLPAGIREIVVRRGEAVIVQ